MAITLADAIVYLGVDNTGLKKGLAKGKAKTQTWTQAVGTMAGNLMSNVISGAARLATTAVQRVGTALLEVGKESVKLAADFESQMATLSIAAKASGLGFDELHDAALAVGGDTTLLGVSATGAADAMTGLYKAGLTTTEIFGDMQGYMAGTAKLGGALRASIDLAAATELDMVQASDLAAVALATFGGELETEAERADFVRFAMDNFVKAADASVAEVGGLAAALRNVGPTAAQFGFTLEETNNALAILSTRGIQGGEAGTALKSMLTNMMRPTEAVRNAMQALGIELYDQNGAMYNLSQIVKQFDDAMQSEITTRERMHPLTEAQNAQYNDAAKAAKTAEDAIRKHQSGLKVLSETKLEGYQAQLDTAIGIIQELDDAQGDWVETSAKMTEEQKNQAIQTIAGTYGMKAMGTLIAEGAEGWDAMAEATANAAGVQEQAAAKADTLNGRWEAFQGNLETLKIEIGEQLMPHLRDLLEWAIKMVDEYGPLLISVFGDFTEAFRSLIDGDMPGFLEKLSDGLVKLGVPKETIDKVYQVIEDLGLTFQALKDGDAEGIVNGLSSALLSLGVSEETIAKLQEPFTKVIEWIQSIPFWLTWLENRFWIWWGMHAEPFLATVEKGFDRATEKWETLKDAIGEKFSGPLERLDKAWSSLLETLGIATGDSEGYFGKFLGNLAEWIVDGMLGQQLDQITGFIDKFSAALDSVNIAIAWMQEHNVFAWLSEQFGIAAGWQLPSWLTPGSPTPFELGIRGITDAMADLSTLGTPRLEAAFAGIGGQTNITNHNYDLTAQYQNRQSPGSLADDVRALSILTAGAA